MSEMTAAERREQTKRMQDDLARQEEQTVSGVRPRSQKQRLIDTAKLHRTFPTKVFRWVRKDRVAEREDLGYEKVSEADAKKGGTATTRHDMVLMAINRAEYERGRRALEIENRRRLGASRGEFMAAVANEEKALRAQGVLASDQTLLVTDSD